MGLAFSAPYQFNPEWHLVAGEAQALQQLVIQQTGRITARVGASAAQPARGPVAAHGRDGPILPGQRISPEGPLVHVSVGIRRAADPHGATAPLEL